MAKILIVDDHAANRELIVTLVKHMKHQALEAADGLEALAKVSAERPQLVICDILMPTMDGYEFVRQLRADPAIADTEVIFYTANYREREARHLASTVGVSRILIKPCEPEEIIHAIDLALAHVFEAAPTASNEDFDREHLRLITDKLAEKADELQSANLRLSALTELNLQLASERDPHTLLDKVCRGARDLIGAKYAFVCVKAKDDGQDVFFFSSGMPADEVSGLKCPVIDHGQFGQVMAERKPLRFLNPDAKPEAIGLPYGYPPVHCGLVAPIVSLSSAYGWLSLVDKLGADEFSAEDERILSIHAAQVGRIYENGSLYVQVQRRAAELQCEIAERIATERQLAYKSSVLQAQQQTSPDAILLVDEDGKIVSYNQQFVDNFSLPKELIAAGDDGPLLSAFVANVADPERFLAKVNYLYEHRDEKSTDEFSLKDGRIIDRYSSPVRGEGDIYFGRVWYFRDITERKKAEEKIRRLNRLYAVLSGINMLIVRVRDRDELFREACRIAIDAGQFVNVHIVVIDPISQEMMLVASHNTDPSYLEELQKVFQIKTPKAQAIFDQIVGQRQPLVMNDSAHELPSDLQGPTHILGTGASAVLPIVISDRVAGFIALDARETGFFDADEMRLLLELAGDIAFAIDHLDKAGKLNYLAHYDALTGLANRQLFIDRVAHYVEAAGHNGHMVAVLVMNVDRFKTINDTLGRPAGDELLKQIAKRFGEDQKDQLRHARIGADTFAIVIPEMKTAEEVARRIEAKLAQYFATPYPLGNTELRVSARIGVALFPHDGADAETLFMNAEAALKKTKAGGERYLFYTQKMTERVAERLSFENKLRRAVEREEFVLHYQPKVTLEQRRIVGVEALIRWNDPETGLIPPIQFISLLEETGLILNVGAWALRRAVADHARWLEAGLAAPRVAVNVSAIQLRQKNFVEMVRQVITAGPASPGIDLEITESLVMDDIDGNIAKLKAVRALGLNIAIDDFGTGYSSLAYLARLPVQILKIDRSFVITMLNDSGTMTLVSTMLTLAHSLGLKVVAEGVDQEDQAKMLRLLRCDEMQGYLFSKPVPFDEMSVMLKAGG